MADPISVPIGEIGYKDMIEKAVEHWYVELQDGAGNKLLRINTSDSRCERIGTAGTSPVRFKVTVTGSDVPSLPVSVERAAIFRNATDSTPIAEGPIAGALLYLPTDRVAVITPIYVPE